MTSETEKHRQLFEEAHTALTNAEAALRAARASDINEGRFTAKVGGVTLELQWPYEGWSPVTTERHKYELRFYVEGKLGEAPKKERE